MSLFPRDRVLVGALAVALMMLVPTGSAFAKPGNSLNAKSCYKGGWTAMTQADETSFFASQDACVSYGAHGGSYRRVFAIAFTNLDGVAGFNSATDVLIADLVDANGSNTVSADDKVHMGSYPLDLAATTFGTFDVPSHTVTGIFNVDPGQIFVSGAGGDAFLFEHQASREVYAELNEAGSVFADHFADEACDNISVDTGSPSAPSDEAYANGCENADLANNSWIDVKLNLP